ncbi:MAG: hypothetical protein QOG34_2003 [Frankiaceae bacterium]|nr:hypothetical protein [Frankiaceae bacterium]
MRWPRLLIAGSAVLALGSLTAPGTGAAFSAVSANGTNSFSAAASFGTCPTTAPAIEWMDGFEMGRIFGGHASGLALGANTTNVTLDSTTVRHGSYAMKVNANGAATNAERLLTVATSVAVVRFSVLLSSLPAADVELARTGPSSGTQLQLLYHSSTQKLALQFSSGTSVESSSTVSAGQWYVIDLRVDQSTATWAASWQVNQVAQTGRTVAGTAGTNVYAVWFGTTLANTFTADYDDIAITTASADYPLADGKVLMLKPNGMGTSVGAGNLSNDDASAIGSSSYTRVDDIPMANSTDYIRQTVASGTSYVELNFEDTTDSCVRMVQGLEMNNLGNTNQSNAAKTSIFDGTTERVVFSGNMAASVAGEYVRVAAISPTGTHWTPSELNGLVMRLGYATDVSPVPRWDAVLIEYEVPL